MALQKASQGGGPRTFDDLQRIEDQSAKQRQIHQQQLEQLKLKGEIAEQPLKEAETKANIAEKQSATAKNSAQAANAKAEGAATTNERADEIQNSFALNGVPLPQGVTPYGKEKAKFWAALAADPRYKDKSPEEISMLAKTGKLDTVAAVKETTQAAGRVAQVAGASTSIFQSGGIADQLFDAAKETGLPNVKLATQSKDALSKIYSNPKWSKYKELQGELVAEMGVVISKANPTVNGAQEAKAMFPLVSSQAELKEQLDAARKVSGAIEKGNQTVLDAIKNRKPLSDILSAADQDGGKKEDPLGIR
jgi:hypothetical protein